MTIKINTNTQTLNFQNKTYKISTAKNGLGEVKNSFKTPHGKFKISEKIGDGVEIWTIFEARKKIGIWDKKKTAKDLILSRILWLDGLEDFNKNTKHRYIYIHGTNCEKDLGNPTSMGCIRMKNIDIIDLFEKVIVGELLEII